ncbi:MAG: hypothetical protein AAGA62_09500, partial [Bacteroidota bacterium]
MVTQHFWCEAAPLQEYFVSYYLIEGLNNDRSSFRIFPSNNSVLSLGWRTDLVDLGDGFLLRSSKESRYAVYFDSITSPMSFEYQGPIYELSFLIRPAYSAFFAQRITELRANEREW